MTSDLDLLRRFARENSQDAFAEIVRRHLNLVYSAALRQVRSPQLAEDISQSVFADLARNAGKLAGGGDASSPQTLTPWLYAVTRRTAIDAIRKESRRQLREQIAVEMNTMNATANDWTQIAPLLDDALAALDETDRSAILLRYFENKNLREVGEVLGATEDAAQKRVSRAVERLREFFSKRNVMIGASGLAVLISANAVQSAPIGLAATISAAAVLAGTAVHTSTAIAATKAVAMITLQKTLVTATVAVLAGAGIYEARQASQLRDQNQTLQQQQAPLAEQTQQLQRERDDATNRLAGLLAENEQLKSNSHETELLKLRNEVTLLRQSQAAPQASESTTTGATETTAKNGPSPEDVGRELGMAVVRGEAGAFDKLLGEIRSEYQSLNTNRVGLNDQQLGELSARTFTPANEAFKVIGDAAAEGKQYAIDALIHAFELEELKGLAVNSFGTLAGNGDAGAVDVLTHPDKYGVLLSSTIAPLQSAADHGNQAAIDALAAIANDKANQPLWYMTANSLTVAAITGNSVAIDGLINISTSTNASVRDAAVVGLRIAAANQNAKAAQVLNALGVR